uniref:Uncharacterized protein n=1 Tax=Arundo donax TaxID=35708 RepID=A0A0A8YQ70_ARUDO
MNLSTSYMSSNFLSIQLKSLIEMDKL